MNRTQRVARQVELKSIYRAYASDPAFERLRHDWPGLVPGRGSMNPHAVFVGEAPGENETDKRKPFVGPAGQVFNRLLDSIGLTRQQVFVTNVVKYRPVVGTVTIRNRTPNSWEIGASRSYLWREIEVFGEGVPVVTMGATALRALYPEAPSISEWHGRGWYDAYRMYVAIYHPAVGVYDPEMMPVLIRDMRTVADVTLPA
jgi:uracil-DNA glycosylase family 4